MEVINPRTALLSNYEVLTLLRELENDHLSRARAAISIKKEEDASQAINPSLPQSNFGTSSLDASENLRTVEVEAIRYLSADYLPTNSQNPEVITRLVNALEPYDLTKAEKLQIVNLVPSLAVELYVIVEELEDRFGERMDEILSLVRAAIPGTGSSTSNDEPKLYISDEAQIAYENNNKEFWGVDYNDAGLDGADFDDAGEGAGIEGDLEMEED